MRDRPHTGSRFLVAIGEHDGREAAAGFAEVVFPSFTHHRERETTGDADGARLVLRRGVTGQLDLYAWWDEVRRGKTPPTRTVRVHLLADDHRTVVTLSYSPLNAMDSAVLMEEVALAFEHVEME
jgi:hypothetical protein